jgi:hypothetical protein
LCICLGKRSRVNACGTMKHEPVPPPLDPAEYQAWLDGFFTFSEAAAVCRCNEITLRRAAKQGRYTIYKASDRLQLLRRREVLQKS